MARSRPRRRGVNLLRGLFAMGGVLGSFWGLVASINVVTRRHTAMAIDVRLSSWLCGRRRAEGDPAIGVARMVSDPFVCKTGETTIQ